MIEAKKAFEKALALGEPTEALLNDYGYYHFLIGDDKNAEVYYRKALQRNPDFTPAWTNLGLTLGEQSRFDEARQAFHRSSKTPADAHINMGYVFAKRNMFNEAQTEFSLALSEQPDSANAVEGLLQVSSKIPGKEAITVVKTVGTHKEPKPIEGQQPENSTQNGMPMTFPFVASHQDTNASTIQSLPPVEQSSDNQ